MRDFPQIERELNLKVFDEPSGGTLYFARATPGAKRLLVRRFDRDLPASLIPAYADMLARAQSWIERDPTLTALVRVEQPVEIGADFIARPHHLGTSLWHFMETDPEEDPPEPPDEMAPMQARFRTLASQAVGAQEKALVDALAHSLLERTSKTFYSFDEERFIVADLKLTRGDLERWEELTRKGEG